MSSIRWLLIASFLVALATGAWAESILHVAPDGSADAPGPQSNR